MFCDVTGLRFLPVHGRGIVAGVLGDSGLQMSHRRLVLARALPDLIRSLCFLLET